MSENKRHLARDIRGAEPWGMLAGIILILFGAIGFLMTWQAGAAFGLTVIAGWLSYGLSAALVIVGVLVAWYT